ncbi:hypothetical protein KC678_01685 [Candidatus Dojkabacteria bacterium]|uniref:Uncharacterized protein n=1 Tax=Candidatus Dojkabacteria bacterium TaxID=2099670 RepID=A0A955I9U5_9BACT|nr:hypothetical protein [Candidatus Dojkabacteria bacterium]
METFIHPEKTVWQGDRLLSCFLYERGDISDSSDWVGSWNHVWELDGIQYMNYGEATYQVTNYNPNTGSVELTKVENPTEA